MKQQIIEELEKIATQFSAEELTEVIESIYCNSGVVTTNGNAPVKCDKPGQIYNEILKKCVDGIG